MYKKALSLLLLCNGIVLMGCFCVQEVAQAALAAAPHVLLRLEDMEAVSPEQALLRLEDMEAVSSEQALLRLEDMEAVSPEQALLRLEDMEAMSPEQVLPGMADMELLSQGQILSEAAEGRSSAGVGIADVTASGQRVVSYSVMEQGEYRFLEEDELDVLRRIVEAEAGNEDEDGRLLVANVVLNRVDSDSFPDTVTEVVFQSSKGVTQFSPVASGRIHTVEVSDETIEAVDRALAGEDISQGALYFAARRYASSRKMKWFDEKLTFLFRHGGHEFYK